MLVIRVGDTLKYRKDPEVRKLKGNGWFLRTYKLEQICPNSIPEFRPKAFLHCASTFFDQKDAIEVAKVHSMQLSIPYCTFDIERFLPRDYFAKWLPDDRLLELVLRETEYRRLSDKTALYRYGSFRNTVSRLRKTHELEFALVLGR